MSRAVHKSEACTSELMLKPRPSKPKGLEGCQAGKEEAFRVTCASLSNGRKTEIGIYFGRYSLRG